jgi:sodium channel modifier 1
MKGSRHRAAESKLKERELARQDAKNKRIALSDCSTAVSSATTFGQRFASANKPLIKRAQKAASEIIDGRPPQGSTIQNTQDFRSYNSAKPTESPSTQNEGISAEVGTVSGGMFIQQFDFRERRERELKFTAAGWKRDCHGRWFKDENVRFGLQYDC